MAGADYTFGLGNGLNVMAEHMLIWNGEKPFDMTERRHMSALSVNYPLGLWNNLSHQEKQ